MSSGSITEELFNLLPGLCASHLWVIRHLHQDHPDDSRKLPEVFCAVCNGQEHPPSRVARAVGGTSSPVPSGRHAVQMLQIFGNSFFFIIVFLHIYLSFIFGFSFNSSNPSKKNQTARGASSPLISPSPSAVPLPCSLLFPP